MYLQLDCQDLAPSLLPIMFPTRSHRGQHALLQAEDANAFAVKTLLKQPANDRDLPALRLALGAAHSQGFAHGGLQKAAAVLAWSMSAVDVVLDDQAVALLTGECSARALRTCPDDAFAIVGRTSFGRCEVVTCVHVPKGADKRLAVEKVTVEVPALKASTGIDQYNHVLKAMVKQKRKVGISTVGFVLFGGATIEGSCSRRFCSHHRRVCWNLLYSAVCG